MPYKNPDDKLRRAKEYRDENKEKIAEKKKEYRQRPEVKEKQKEHMKNYNQIQRFKKRQEIGEESWYKGQLMGFNGSCAMYYSNVLNIEYKKDEYEIYRHSRNHEFLHMIYLKNKAYESWLKNGFAPSY
jgi:lipid II:glycine glycyltransferase (peptidoglycan interpeptide bridge formation enzyme)